MKLPFSKKASKKKSEKKEEKKKKEVEREGSKYASLLLLAITVLVGLLFYLQGQVSTQGLSGVFEGVGEWFTFSREFVIE